MTRNRLLMRKRRRIFPKRPSGQSMKGKLGVYSPGLSRASSMPYGVYRGQYPYPRLTKGDPDKEKWKFPKVSPATVANAGAFAGGMAALGRQQVNQFLAEHPDLAMAWSRRNY